MIEPQEIVPGLVLFLDPAVLLGNGGTFNGPIMAATRNPHFFVCQSVRGDRSTWVPTSSKPGWDRTRVRAKVGHPEWVNVPTYAFEEHRWAVDFVGLRLAARRDWTCAGARNYAEVDFVHPDQIAA